MAVAVIARDGETKTLNHKGHEGAQRNLAIFGVLGVSSPVVEKPKTLPRINPDQERARNLNVNAGLESYKTFRILVGWRGSGR